MNSATMQRVRQRLAPIMSGHAAAEVLVSDPRGMMSPAQMVENKLCSILGDSAIRVSDMRRAALPRRRGPR